MSAANILAALVEGAIVPVVRASSPEAALQAVEAIANGGIRSAEITMTVPGAVRVLEKLADRFGGNLLLGAGTVLDPETARACMLAGAEFIVSPSLKPATIEMAKRYSKPVFPGALTPTEVLTAWEAGADAVKIFPCGNVGGAKYIKALKGPFPQIEMIPTGGVNLETIGEFLKAGACAVAWAASWWTPGRSKKAATTSSRSARASTSRRSPRPARKCAPRRRPDARPL